MPISGPVSQAPGLAPVLVLGLGNSLLTDDGVGLELLKRLSSDSLNWPDQVEFLDGGTQGLMLLGALSGRQSLVILDAVRMGAPPGTTHFFYGKGMQVFHHTRGSGAHETDARELLQTAELLGDTPENIALIGIEPQATNTGIGLSPAVQNSLDDALGKARAVVEAMLVPLRANSPEAKDAGRKKEGEHYVSGGTGANQEHRSHSQ